MAKLDSSTAAWLDKAEAYCARAEHCAFEVRRKLEQWGVEPALHEPILESLYQNDFLNDARFCRAYVHDKLEYQHWGRVKIQAMLQSLHLPDRAIREGMATIDEQHYLNILRQVANLRRTATPEQRLRFLQQRGFTYEEMKKCK